MTVEFWVGELTTGKKLAVIPSLDSSSWETTLNNAGPVDVTVPLRAVPWQRPRDFLSYLEPGRCYIAAVTTGTRRVLEAGPIWKGRFIDRDGRLRVGGSGMWSLFDHRKIINPAWEANPTSRVQDSKAEYINRSLQQIAIDVVSDSLARQGGSLPIVLPASAPAGTNARTYFGYEVKDLGEALRELTQVEDGPELAFEPRVRADGLGIEWVMRVGEPLVAQPGAFWRWDRGAARGDLRDLDVEVDATGLGQRAWAVGSGMETEQVIGSAADLTPLGRGYPLLEVRSEHPTVLTQTTINAHAGAGRDRARRPWRTYRIDVSTTNPDLGAYRPGDWASLVIPRDHEYEPPGTRTCRILAISGGIGQRVTVTMAPTMEDR